MAGEGGGAGPVPCGPDLARRMGARRKVGRCKAARCEAARCEAARCEAARPAVEAPITVVGSGEPAGATDFMVSRVHPAFIGG